MLNKMIAQWKEDEEALFKGWDFSYIKNRIIEESPPWSYVELAKTLIKESTSMLDMGTGGGELMESLAPLPEKSVATERYFPNILVARDRLDPLGVKVVDISNFKEPTMSTLPFQDAEFDLIINRHEAFNEKEVYRILKPGGIFLTQQVSKNLIDLSKKFNSEPKWTFWNLTYVKDKMIKADFLVDKAEEWQGDIIFKDVGAIVYFLKAIPWLVDDFSVDNHLKHLKKLQEQLEQGKPLSFTKGRFLISARKA